jgi:putative IMPACT (imprinted ancient) family translation regulator
MAGISVVRRWVEVTVDCPYNLFDRMKLEVENTGGVLGEVEYTASVTIHALLPEGVVEHFSALVTELTAGSCTAAITGEAFKAVPRIDK